jgi:hypothetical protein
MSMTSPVLTGMDGDGAKTLVSYLKESQSSLTHVVSINDNTCIGGPEGAEVHVLGSFLVWFQLPRLIHIELGNVLGAAEGGAFLAEGLHQLLQRGNKLEYVHLLEIRLKKMMVILTTTKVL